MADLSDSYIQRVNIDPIIIVDTTGTTTYTGFSCRFAIETAPIWRIKKIWQVGSVIYTGFPNGSQGFEFIWTDRESYTYS
jgi:hypothetical protein